MNHRVALSVFFGFAAFAGVLIWLTGNKNTAKQPKVENFEQCVAAGYPVMESYPSQCTTPSGRFFVETLVPEK